jgi:hypothetical protein
VAPKLDLLLFIRGSTSLLNILQLFLLMFLFTLGFLHLLLLAALLPAFLAYTLLNSCLAVCAAPPGSLYFLFRVDGRIQLGIAFIAVTQLLNRMAVFQDRSLVPMEFYKLRPIPPISPVGFCTTSFSPFESVREISGAAHGADKRDVTYSVRPAHESSARSDCSSLALP